MTPSNHKSPESGLIHNLLVRLILWSQTDCCWINYDFNRFTDCSENWAILTQNIWALDRLIFVMIFLLVATLYTTLMPAKSLGIFYVFIREESGVAPVQRDNFRWCQVCLSSGLLTHLVSLNFWFLKLTPGGSQVTAGGSKSHGDNRHLDLDQILPRFNVQLKHNAAKWEYRVYTWSCVSS